MDVQTLTRFFMWCSIINGGLFALSAAICMAAPGFVYRVHSKWFHISRETFNVAIYSFLGLFKVFFLVLNLVPFVALLIVG